MYNLPYAYTYALSIMRRITLVLMHILIQLPSPYKSVYIGTFWPREISQSTSQRSIQSNSVCCINRSQLSYGLDGLALIRADGVQPSLHLDEYVRVRTVYIWPCGPLRKYN
jgi:hypothetical protein